MAIALGACAKSHNETPATHAPVELKASVDKAVATTGDVITYTVSINHAANVHVEMPDPGASIVGLSVTDTGRSKPVTQGDRIVEERWYKVRADLVGTYVLPAMTLSYSSSDTPPKTGTAQTSEIFIEVKSVLPADGETAAQDIRGLKPLRPSPRNWQWLAWVGAASVLLALGAAAYWYKRKKSRDIVIAPPLAHEIAFAVLNSLRQTDFTDAQATRMFYFGISDCLRTYVEARYAFNATDLTSEEILQKLVDITTLSSAHRTKLREFLEHSDQVKFADLKPTQEDIARTYEQALSFVEETYVRPVTPAAEAA